MEMSKKTFTKASFWIGAGIIFLTIYLFIFYSSAAYSAFFKNFTPEDGSVTQTIFDAQAFVKAWNDGFAELILILTIPAVFLWLGFLIHKFQEQKDWRKYLKITGLAVIIFFFNCLLAYEITAKIYNIKLQGGLETMPPMTISYALQQINFWLIIFAGFVVNLIWSIMFRVLKTIKKS